MIALAEICLRYLIVCTSHVNRAIKSAPVIVYIGQIFFLQISTTSRTICCQQRVLLELRIGTFLFNKHIFSTKCFFSRLFCNDHWQVLYLQLLNLYYYDGQDRDRNISGTSHLGHKLFSHRNRTKCFR